jgi:predicted porin
MHRSNNADVQRNPLIGNFALDPNQTEVGGEIRTKPFQYGGALVGLASGTTTENFVEGRRFGYHGKVWITPVKAVRASGSYYRVDHSNSAPKAAGGPATNMFNGNRSGDRYGGVFGGAGAAPGGVLIGANKDVTAWEGDLTFDLNKARLFVDYGSVEDADLNGSLAGTPKESWNYYGAEGVYNFTDKFYGAARYSAATADEINGISADGTVSRIQVGGGYWLNKYLLAKLEYVNEKFSDFGGTTIINNVQANRDPEFSGVLMEVSFSF